MASQNVDQQSTAVESKSDKLKLDQSQNNINADCPLFQLPDDILAEIIGHVPITQWPDLELVSTRFREVTHLAWRSLRRVNLDDDFKFEPNNNFMLSIECVLEKLIDRAPFIKSLKGVMFQVDDPNLNAMAVELLSKFENLEAISFSSQFRDIVQAIRAEDLITFIESTCSRTKLKEIEVEHYEVDNIEEFLDSFAIRVQTVLANNLEERQRMPLEKLIIGHELSPNWESVAGWQGLFSFLDNSMLTSLSLGSSPIEPQLLSNLIQSAPNLRHLGFAFVCCPTEGECDGPRVESYKRLMDTLANHSTVSELRFFDSPYGFNAGENCWKFEAEFMQMLELIGPRLRALKIDLANFLHDEFFNADEIAAVIFRHMPALKSIHLRVDDSISTENIKNIVRLQDLEEISLEFDNQHINGDIIATIGQSTRLKSLRLCEYVNDPDEMGPNTTFLGLATLTALKKLAIDVVQYIPSDVLVAWANGFGSTLEQLRLSKVSDDAQPGLIDLIKKTNRLRVLDLSGVIFTDAILDAVATSCPNLEYIGGLTLPEGNFVAVQTVIDACLKLKMIRTSSFKVCQYLRAQLKIDKYRNISIH